MYKSKSIVSYTLWSWNFYTEGNSWLEIYHKNFSPFTAAETPWKIFYLASAENKMNLYRAKYESSGNETFNTYFLSKDEHSVKFSHLIKHHTGHEK